MGGSEETGLLLLLLLLLLVLLPDAHEPLAPATRKIHRHYISRPPQLDSPSTHFPRAARQSISLSLSIRIPRRADTMTVHPAMHPSPPSISKQPSPPEPPSSITDPFPSPLSGKARETRGRSTTTKAPNPPPRNQNGSTALRQGALMQSPGGASSSQATNQPVTS
jgi:hypothetical protein